MRFFRTLIHKLAAIRITSLVCLNLDLILMPGSFSDYFTRVGPGQLRFLLAS